MSVPDLRVASLRVLSFRPHRARLPSRTMAMLALIIANVIWTGSAVSSKVLLTHMHPLTMSSLRVAIAVVLLSVVLGWRHESVATGRAPALLGLTGVALFCASQNFGLLFADATTTALLGAATPILTLALAASVLGERLGLARMIGIVISLAGVGVIMLLGSGHVSGITAMENVLPLASAICFAVYNVIGRRVFAGNNAIPLVTGSMRYGLAYLLPFTVIEMGRTDLRGVTVQDGMLLVYLGAGCSAVAFLLCGYGLAHLEAGHGGVYGNLKPVVGVALAVTLLGEPLTMNQVGGGVLVLAGIGIAGREWSRQRLPRSSTVPEDGSETIRPLMPRRLAA